MLLNAPRMAMPRAVCSGSARWILRPLTISSRHISGQGVENFRALHSRRQALAPACHVQHGDARYRFRGTQKYFRRNISSVNDDRPKKRHVFVALGSNMGDRIAMIEQACKEMESSGNIRIVRTSSLWESTAMYVVDQDNFVNGVCEIETTLSPIELLDELQAVEQRMGRVKIVEKGPRNIDLDIVLFDDIEYSDERLQIPHPLMFEREFVLRPLSELIPQSSELHFPHRESIQQRLKELPKREVPLTPIVPLAPDLSPIPSSQAGQNTRIMSILNVTPDSFSDGGVNYKQDESTLAQAIRAKIAGGATIIDVGGQSTRPGAKQVTEEEELARVLPAVKLIRSLPEAQNIAISVDTYRAGVAEHVVEAGANMINDVSAGTMDDAMLPTMAHLGCTVCLMHMRGTPETMASREMTSYPDGVVETVGRELLARVDAAEQAGVRRWRMVLDPGIGFAKTLDQNLELLRRLAELMRYPGLQGLPWLVGTSRKTFVGKITGVKEAKGRVWGTAVAVAAAIQGGAHIVRVHDVREMAQVAKMADALWKRG